MTHAFVTHARNVNELREEFLSDHQRRIVSLDGQIKVARNATEKAKIAFATAEIIALLGFWQSVEIRRPKRKKILDMP